MTVFNYLADIAAVVVFVLYTVLDICAVAVPDRGGPICGVVADFAVTDIFTRNFVGTV